MLPYSLDALSAHVPPPAAPVAAPTDLEIAAAERTLGTQLPHDFVEVIQAYGDGKWQQFWYLLNPVSPNPYLNLLTAASLHGEQSTLWAERVTREQDPDYPHPIWPESGGILPWAITDNGGRFFWLSDGPPARWPTVYYPDRSPEYQLLRLGAGEILIGTLTSQLTIFAEQRRGLPNVAAPTFAPISPKPSC